MRKFFPAWFTTTTPRQKPMPLMEKPKVNIQAQVIASATRVLAAYDRALAYIAELKAQMGTQDEQIASLTQTILELKAMLDAKVPADAGGSVGGIVEA